jgi:hypothetical protein
MADPNATPSLNPCPFCSSKAEIVQCVEAGNDPHLIDVHVAQCSTCLCQGPGGATEAEAAAAWNHRGTLATDPRFFVQAEEVAARPPAA